MWRQISVLGKVTVLLCILMFGMTGCALFQDEPEKIQMTVERFHRDDFYAPGKSFVILPNKDQKDDLEFQAYGQEISRLLITNGWRLASNPARADFGVSFTYGVSNGENIVHSEPVYDFVGGGRTVIKEKGTDHKVTIDKPSEYRQVGTKVYTTTVYAKWLELVIVNLKKSSKDDSYRVFQGKTTTKGPRSTFNAVHKCLMWSLLYNNFPGKQGDDHVWFYANKADGDWSHQCVSS